MGSEIQVFNAINHGNRVGWLNTTGLNPSVINAATPLSAEDEELLAIHISALGDSAAWARGDLGLYVREKVKIIVRDQGLDRNEFNRLWGIEIERLSKLLGCATKTLYNNIGTASQWPPEHRRNTGTVRYKHHEALPASMPLDRRIELIEQADTEGWNYKRLYAVVHGHVLEDTGEPTATYTRPEPVANDPVEAPGDFLDDEGEDWRDPDAGTYESSNQFPSQGASIPDADRASFDYGAGQPVNAVSLHIVSSNGGVDTVVNQSTEAMKFCFVFTNGTTWEVSPNLRNGSLDIRRLTVNGE